MNWRRRLLGGFYLGQLGAIVAVIPFVCGIGVWSSRVGDDAVLRDNALAVTAGLTKTSARIWAINDWVYHNHGFAKNNHFFILPQLGATPLQIMESGGDCADKSRLVSAMLRELGIDSGLVMITPCLNCTAIHTVVEARSESGRMVVDPIWDVDYPSGNGKFLGVQGLAGTRLGPEHIADLQRQSAAGDKIQRMPAAEATFDFAMAVNWNKNFATRAVAYGLRRLGYAPKHLLRPQVLEDPKLALTLFLIAFAAALVALGAAIGFAFPSMAENFRPPLFTRFRHASRTKRAVPAR